MRGSCCGLAFGVGAFVTFPIAAAVAAVVGIIVAVADSVWVMTVGAKSIQVRSSMKTTTSAALRCVERSQDVARE